MLVTHSVYCAEKKTNTWHKKIKSTWFSSWNTFQSGSYSADTAVADVTEVHNDVFFSLQQRKVLLKITCTIYGP